MNADTKTSPKRQGSFGLAAAVFGGSALALWPTSIGQFFMFPYDLLAAKDAHQRWHNILTHSQAMHLNVLQWSVATLIFALSARKLRLPFLLLLTPSLFFVVVVAMHVFVTRLGLGFYWDLWH